MTTIPVCKGMNKHKLMMKTHNQLIFIKAMVFNLVASVVQQVTQFHGHLSPVDADVLIALTERSRPQPSPVKHLAV